MSSSEEIKKVGIALQGGGAHGAFTWGVLDRLLEAEHIVAVVDKEACKACGKCVAKCPKHLIELVPYEQTTFVQCSSHAKGKAVTSACEVGCIGCKTR